MLDSAEIYDPSSRTFRMLRNAMNVPRCGHSATVLTERQRAARRRLRCPAISYDPPGVLIAWFRPS